MRHAPQATPCSQWLGAVQSVVVPSGLDFEAAGGSVVCYCLSNYLLRGHRSRCKHDMGALSVKCGNIRKSAHPPLWQTCKVLRPWALFRETTVLWISNVSSSAGLTLQAGQQCSIRVVTSKSLSELNSPYIGLLNMRRDHNLARLNTVTRAPVSCENVDPLKWGTRIPMLLGEYVLRSPFFQIPVWKWGPPVWLTVFPGVWAPPDHIYRNMWIPY